MNDRRAALPPLEELETFATGRSFSIFADDFAEHTAALTERIRDSRIVMIGAAGSIGMATLRCLLPFGPRSVALVDLDENGLAEAIRDIRSTPGLFIPDKLVALPLGIGSVGLQAYFSASEPFDYILNFAAMKHVRSEKNVFSLARMIDTNILALDELLRRLPYRCRNVFSVSSDKAVRPANLMGASKRIMEQVLHTHSPRQPASSARMANVAFSNGSLPAAFLMRIAKRQALAAPDNVTRMFMSHREAGELCLMASILSNNSEIYLPKPDSLGERSFTDIATAILGALGYEPFICESEAAARSEGEDLIRRGQWPCYFSPTATTGEKPHEELTEADELTDPGRYRQIAVVRPDVGRYDTDALESFLAKARQAGSSTDFAKQDYVRAMQSLVPSLRHTERDLSLDDIM